ncbi:MAG: hypothetical protein WKF43_15015 [Acidimicrobiales bacterium]
MARSSGHAGRALLVGTSAVIVVMVGLFVAAVVFAGRDSGEVALGDQTFQGGSAERLATEIADRGPIYYPDVSGRGMERPIILQHLGDDDREAGSPSWPTRRTATPTARGGGFLTTTASRPPATPPARRRPTARPRALPGDGHRRSARRRPQLRRPHHHDHGSAHHRPETGD